MNVYRQDRDRYRVLMTTDTVGGVWVYSMELARALRRDVEFFVASMGAPASEAQIEEADAAGVHLINGGYKLEWMDSPWRDVSEAAAWLRELESEVQPDLVHLNQFAHGSLPWLSPVMVVGHSCVQSWWQAVHGTDAPERYGLYRDVVAAGLHGADCVVAPSRWMLESLRSNYGPLPESFHIYNGRGRGNFAPPAGKASVVFSAGRLWDQAKNIQSLIAVASDLPWPVVIAGPGIERTRCPENVAALGPVTSDVVARWMKEAAIYALPARYEPFGLSVLEAALSGCALVLGDIPSLREIWGETARYVTPDDPHALRATLRELMEDRGLRNEYARRARIRASRYSLERMRGEYLGAYRQLAGAPTGAFKGI